MEHDCVAIFKKYCPEGQFSVHSLQDVDAALPDAIRRCLSANMDPFAMLSELYKSVDHGVQQLAVSYGALLSQYPNDLFNLNATKGEPILRALVKGALVDQPFIDALSEWKEEDDCNGLFFHVITLMIERLASETSTSVVRSIFSAIDLLFSTEKCLSNTLQRNDELVCKLLVSIASSPTLKIDSAITEASEASSTSYQSSLEMLSVCLYSLVMKALKKDRSKVVKMLLDITNANKDRLKMHFDSNSVCSHSCALVFHSVFLKLTQPFMVLSVRAAKEPLIDCEYYSKYPGRLDIDGLNTLLEGEKPKTLSNDHTSAPNFITDSFYMCLHWMKASLCKMIDDNYELSRALSEMEGMLSAYSGNPLIKAKVLADMGRLKAARVFNEVFLMSEQVFCPSLDFIHLMMFHLIKLYCNNNNKQHYSMLPEFYLEVINEVFLHISRCQPQRWLQLHEPLDLFLSYAVLLLKDPQSCRNIYTRAKIVEIIHGWTVPGEDRRHIPSFPLARLFGLTFTDYSSEGHGMVVLCTALTPLLFKMYVDVEVTGAASQFYEKFNIRYHLATVFTLLFDHMSEYRIAMRQESQRPESFLRFQNLLLNDCTFLLDESLHKLNELHKLESTGEQQTPSQQSLQNTRQIERQLTSYMQLANATLKFLTLLTADIQKPFARPEIVSRLAAMLLVNLKQLVGQRCRELRVKNPERYHFDPKALLAMLVRVFVNMSREAAFQEAVRADHRSFESGLLEQQVVNVIERTGAVSTNTLEEFVEAAKQIASLPKPLDDQDDLEQVDPDFLDPLMFTVMKDPVILKTSNVTVDRATIRAHLLNDPHDPFNRLPLSEDDLETNLELKKRIDKWLTDRQH